MAKKIMTGTSPFRLLLIFVVAILFAYLLANCSGFCINEMRYLSDEEKLNSAMRYFARIEQRNSCWGVGGTNGNRREVCPIPYKSLKEFMEQNPQCCKLIRANDYHGGEGDGPPTFGDRVFGIYNYVVDAEFLEREIWHDVYDAEGNIIPGAEGLHVKKVRQIVRFSNCGDTCAGARRSNLFFLLLTGLFGTHCYID